MGFEAQFFACRFKVLRLELFKLKALGLWGFGALGL
jgi:hypothetical protein